MRKKITDHIIYGLGIGFLVTTVSLWLFGLAEAPGIAVMRQFTTWLAASALYGLISLIYDTDIPFPSSLAIHFAACAAVTYAASAVSGIMEFIRWYEWFKFVLPYFVVTYIIIGFCVTIISRCGTEKINKIIKNRKPEE